MATKWGMVLPLLVFLSACTTIPTGPNVMVLPGAGKPFEQFQADDAVCRHYAQQQSGASPGQSSTYSTLSGAALGTLLGAGAGAAIGAAAGRADVGAAVGAGTGLLTGTAAGAESGGTAAGTLQGRYDMAYVQCMYAKGHQVPGTTTARQPGVVPSPPPQAPPPFQTPPPG